MIASSTSSRPAPVGLSPDVVQARIIRERCLRQGGFKVFVRYFWEYVEPRKLIWNWHLDVLCWVLEALGRGLVNRVLINLPPGYAKSILCDVLWPAWKWALDPTWSCIFGSHDEALALRDSVKSRDLMKHAEFVRIFRPAWGITGESWDFSSAQDTKHLFKTTRGGMRYSTSVGGAITGFRGSAVVIDDPLDANKAPSEVKLREHIDWFTNLGSRIDDVEHSQWLVIMQRLCEGDLSDYLIKKGGWLHVCLPAEYDPDDPRPITWEDEVLFEDPRAERGEPLFPQYQSKKALAFLREYLTDVKFETQYNQNAMMADGGMVRFEDASWHDVPLVEIRRRSFEVLVSADLTFMKNDAGQEKENERRAYNVLQVWAFDGSNFYPLEELRGRWQWPEAKEAFSYLAKKWGIWTCLVEDATVSGIIINELEQIFHNVELVKPQGSKEARCSVAARYWRLGKVWLPKGQEWAMDMLTEIVKFPLGMYKDRVDAMSQAILWWTSQRTFQLDSEMPAVESVYEQEPIEPLSNSIATVIDIGELERIAQQYQAVYERLAA